MREKSRRARRKFTKDGPAKLQPSPVVSVEASLRTPMPALRVGRVCSRHEGDAIGGPKHGAVFYRPTSSKVRPLAIDVCVYAIHTLLHYPECE